MIRSGLKRSTIRRTISSILPITSIPVLKRASPAPPSRDEENGDWQPSPPPILVLPPIRGWRGRGDPRGAGYRRRSWVSTIKGGPGLAPEHMQQRGEERRSRE